MKKVFSKIIFISVLSMAIVFTGCTKSVINHKSEEHLDNSENDFIIDFTDDEGREIKLTQKCKKIISLYSPHTENLFSLGAGSSVIGVGSSTSYPPETALLTIYDYKSDAEKVIAAEPDLVLIRPFITRKSPDFIKLIENAGITVVSLYPEKYDEFDEYIMKLASITGTEERAKNELDNFHSNIEQITDTTKNIEEKKNVFFESTEVNLRTVTKDSMAANGIEFAGGINVASAAKAIEENSSIASFGAEKILSVANEIDVYVSQKGAMNAGGNAHSISIRPGFDTIKAVKNGDIFIINEKLISSPTFRYYKGVKELARFMYPEIFDNIDEYNTLKSASKRDVANIIVKSCHIPIYVTSSNYYSKEIRGHMYGMFEDVNWEDSNFDAVETAVMCGAMEWEAENGKQVFKPHDIVTRQELAKSLFILGDFKNSSENIEIYDLESCENQNIIQIVVDNGVFRLNNGNFEPEKEVTCNEVVEALKMIGN